MDETAIPHPSDSEIDDFLRRSASPERALQIDRHIAGCLQCQARLCGSAPAEAGHARRTWVWILLAASVALVALGALVVRRLVLPPQPAVVVLRDEGGVIALGHSGNLRTPIDLSPKYAMQVSLALKSARLPLDPAIAALPRNKETPLGRSDEVVPFELFHPSGEAAISDRPVFSWRELPRATAYRVSVYDGNANKIAESPEIAATQWTPDQPLSRGATYTWTVTATVGGQTVRAPVPPAPEARFVVLAADVVEPLIEAQREYPGAHLLLACLFARAGAFADARTEVRALAAANPHSMLPRQLEDSLPKGR